MTDEDAVPRLAIRVSALLMGVALASVPPNAGAQNSMATLRGRVVDEQGGSLEGVALTARSTATNASRTVVAGSSGQYFIPHLPPGSYELRASLAGFSEARMDGLVLQIGQEATVDVILKVGGVREELLVTGATPLLETTRNTIGAIIDGKQIDQLPVIDRDFASLALLAPGVTIGTGGNGPSLSVNGQRGFANSFYVDGATAEWQHFGKQSSTFVQDWIQEFQVMTNSYPAEFGTASGGIINAITRSGTNEFHGRLYGFFRDDALDAAPFAGRFDARGKPAYLDATPALSQTRLGGFLGGPILKNRLFFFAGYERFDRDSTAVLSISDYWRQRGVRTILPLAAHDDPFMIKLDADFEGRNHVSVRFDRTNRIDTNQPQLSLLETEETRHRFGGPIWNVVGSWTTTISNSRFNEFRAVYGSNKAPIVCNKSGTGGPRNLELGPPGTFSQQEYPGAIFGCPVFSGLQGETTIQIADAFSWAVGHHQLKTGVQGYRVRTILDLVNHHNGTWSFPSDIAFDAGNPASYPLMLIANVGTMAVDPARWNLYIFVQDTWQPRNNLTVNLGLRYDYDTSVQTGNEYVGAKNAQILARRGGPPLLEKTRADTDNLAPRLGIVWTPGSSKRTVVRIAVGRFYDQNHNNFNAIYLMNTLLTDGAFAFNAAAPLSWGAFGSPQALRLYLAQNFPYFPDFSQAPASAEYINRNEPGLEVAYTDQYTIGASHELGHGVSAEADYVFSRGWGAPAIIDTNIAVSSDGLYHRPDSRFGRIGTVFNIGKAVYHALLAQARYRGARGALHAAYTLSKATSNSSSNIFAGFGGTAPTNPFDISEDQGYDDADRRHNLVLDGNLTLPWSIDLSGAFIYRSAPPWSVTTRQQLDGDPFPDRPEPRNSRRGDAFSTLDIRVAKGFRIGDRIGATAYWEIYNLLNSDNFSGYVGVLESPLFGLPTGAAEKRRQQAGFRIDF